MTSSNLVSSDSLGGSSANAFFMHSRNSRSSENDRHDSKFSKKNSFEGWWAQTTHFPMASASAIVVHSTSLWLGFTKTWGRGQCVSHETGGGSGGVGEEGGGEERQTSPFTFVD